MGKITEAFESYDSMLRLNKVLADVETGLLYDIAMGMAGTGESGSAHSLETPEFDAQPRGGGSIETRPGA